MGLMNEVCRYDLNDDENINIGNSSWRSFKDNGLSLLYYNGNTRYKNKYHPKTLYKIILQ